MMEGGEDPLREIERLSVKGEGGNSLPEFEVELIGEA
jgi:hypothetical protein